MKRRFTILTAALALLVSLAIPMGMWGQTRDEVVAYTLTPVATGGNSAPHNSYTAAATTTINGIGWSVMGNSSMVPWRIGGKNISGVDRPLYSTTAISDNISKIEVTHGAASSITVNSWTVIVASDADFTNVVSTLTPTFAANATTTINRPDGKDWSNCYYKFVYNVTVSGSSNKFLEFSQAKFYKETGTTLQESDLSLSPSALTFDLYDAEAKTITISTSSTGTISVSNNAYVTTQVNGVATITVTPVAVTPEAQTITVSQAATNTYEAGSKTFTVTVTNSAPTYTVTYHANVTGTANIVETYYEGDDVTVAANTFSNPGYIFTKWNTNANGTETDYLPNATISNIQSNIDLYAQWEESNEISDCMDREFTGVNGPVGGTASSYTEWSNKTGASGAVYAGQSAGGSSTSGSCIQLRSNNNNSGIVTTASGGKAVKVIVTWNSATSSGRTLNIYGKNSAYTDATDLYDNTKQGTLLGTIVCGSSTEFTISGEYTFVGMRSASGAMYLNQICITWESTSVTSPSITVNPNTLNDFSYPIGHGPSAVQSISVSGANLTADISVTLSNDSNYEISDSENGTYGSAVTLSRNGSLVAATPVYVRMKSDLPVGNYTNESISIASAGATTVSIPLNGNVVTPMTVTDAIAAIDNAPDNVVSGAYVAGIVSSIDSYNANYHSITYYISVDGTTTTELQVYSGKGINGADFNAVTDLSLGDQVVVYGNLKLYNGVYEFDYNNYLVYWVHNTAPIINADNNLNIAYNATSGEIAYTIINPVNGQNLTATSDDTWISDITVTSDKVTFNTTANSTSSARTATITLSYPGATDKVVTVTQAAYVPAPSGNPYVRITSLDQLTNGSIVVIASRYDENATNYYAMGNTIGNKISVTEFVSETLGSLEILPSTIVNSVNSYYWVVSVNNGTYTFTNASGDMIGYGGSTNFATNGDNTTWSIVSGISGAALVPNYAGFTITNTSTDRGIALKNNATPVVFGAYATSNANDDNYNFFLDFFVQTEPQTYTKDITGWSAPGNNLNFYLIASPIGDVNPTAVTIEGDATATMVSGSFDLYYFDQAQANEWINYKPNTSGEGNASTNPGFNLERGTGYLYANQNTVTLEFTGTGSNSGEFPVELVYVSGAGIDLPGWNLLGNPFTENAYLVSNNSYRSFYTLDVNGNYLSVTGNVINAMEGIFVKANGTGESVTFTTTQLGRKSSTLALNLSNGRNLIDRAIVRFDGGDQLPKLQFRQGSTKVYIPVEGQDYAVVNCEEMGAIPVNFKAEENGRYNLSLSTEEVSFAYLHLIDNMTGADVDLLQTPSYSFEAKTTDYESRFKLVFATGDNSNDDNFAFFSNGSFVINNDGDATLQVIDVTGRIVKSESINGCTNVNVNAAAGVYMLRLINGDNVKVQKVVVK